MRPLPRSSMWGRTWWASVIGTSRLTPMTAEVVGILLSDLTDDLDAALLMRTSIGPWVNASSMTRSATAGR